MDVLSGWAVGVRGTMGNYTALVDKNEGFTLEDEECPTEDFSDSPSKTGSYSSLDGSPPRMRTEYIPMSQGDEEEEQEVALSISKLQLKPAIRTQWDPQPTPHRLSSLTETPRSRFSHLIKPWHDQQTLEDLAEPPHRSEEFRQWLQQSADAGASLEYLDPMHLHQLSVPSALDTVLEITQQAQLIAQSIGQAFQVAYMEFLKANGIEDPGMMKEMDYQEVLNQQEIYGEELYMFSNKEMQKEVIVPKLKTEPLGVVIVESGWGSMVPTVVLANMQPGGAAARCGQLNIGDQIISINGISLVGLPLSSCQNYIKAAKNQTVVKLTVVSCPPVVEVLIKRPDVKYQLGFSVQNGVICSLLRGGIAERGGVRVGHRIIEINGQSVVAVPHEKIVNMLATSVGEIHMKTMPTSIFRLLTGQETPHYL